MKKTNTIIPSGGGIKKSAKILLLQVLRSLILSIGVISNFSQFCVQDKDKNYLSKYNYYYIPVSYIQV